MNDLCELTALKIGDGSARLSMLKLFC